MTGKSDFFIHKYICSFLFFGSKYRDFFFFLHHDSLLVRGPVGCDHFNFNKLIFFCIRFFDSHKVKFFLINNYKRETISPLVFSFVPPSTNTKIITDKAPVFLSFSQHYKHISLNHSRGQYWTPEGTTNPTENEIGQVKNFLKYVNNGNAIEQSLHFWETKSYSQLGERFFDFLK